MLYMHDLVGYKITADSDCSHEIKRCFTPWKESYDQPRQHIKNHLFDAAYRMLGAGAQG